jgi:hypothetical protein
MPKSAKALADEIEDTWNRAEREGRDLTADERKYMSGLVEEAKAQHGLEQSIKQFSQSVGAPLMARINGASGNTAGGGPGDVFVQSKAYKQVQYDRRPRSPPATSQEGPRSCRRRAALRGTPGADRRPAVRAVGSRLPSRPRGSTRRSALIDPRSNSPGAPGDDSAGRTVAL